MDNRIVFHFNKASLGNPAIPPWVVKTQGQTHYVWHLDAQVGFSTKETPDNPHTQGSIQFRGHLTLREVGGRLHARITEVPSSCSPTPNSTSSSAPPSTLG
jgi:hypothetical protein